MYLIYVFILFELCLLFLNSCMYSIHVFIIFEFMCSLFFEYMYLLLNCFMFLFIISRHVFCYIHFMT